jgi:putative inorganic carbon (HCO3(-)) transporter
VSEPIPKMAELGLSLLVGLLASALLIFSWGLESSWQNVIVLLPVALFFVLLVNDLEKIVLATIAIGVPLNLDISLVISPYARNPENLARGYRTLIALTELRLSIVLVVLVIGYALWLIKPRDGTRKPVRFFAGTSVPALGFIFFALLSVTQAQDSQLSFFRIVQLFELFLAYFYLANHVRTRQDMQFYIVVSLGATLAESLLMIGQWITGWTFTIAGIEAVVLETGKVGGTVGHSGPAAGYLSAQVLIAGAMMWAFPQKRQKIFAATCFGAGVLALISTGSRIGWVAFAVTIFLFALIGLRLGWIKRQTLALLVVATLALLAPFYNRFYTRFTADDSGSAEARLMMYRLAWEIVQARPWLGVGAGNYALVTPDYYSPDVGDAKQVIDIQVHNRYLLIWAENGVLALLCYLGFLGVAVAKAWSCLKSDEHFISLLGAGIGLAIVSLCIQMLTGTFHVRPITLYTWLLPALAASLYHIEQTRSTHAREKMLGEGLQEIRYATHHS